MDPIWRYSWPRSNTSIPPIPPTPISARRFCKKIAKDGGHVIVHKPIELRQVIAVNGPGSTNSLTEGRRAYFSGREIVRWAEYRGIEIMAGRPTHHDHGLDLPNGMLIAGIEQGADINALAHGMLESHWRDDCDLADAETLADIGRRAGLDPQPLLDAALSDDIQAIHVTNTQEAIQRSVFGSPTYFVGGDMFYGQDHLELVARAVAKPFAGAWPPVG
ncbi:MAG: 2-hydroxychromene-2-carboxylate isomerase [Rhodospirillaceae bacterium]|nr:2-hydroxychromene-2-carboxylate isomerase [Rhodospirillaceae bacterium]MBT6610344.1 2-hydroxychromene-2-carboxylate isomerase [Rhodospirillaceae bacterium]